MPLSPKTMSSTPSDQLLSKLTARMVRKAMFGLLGLSVLSLYGNLFNSLPTYSHRLAIAKITPFQNSNFWKHAVGVSPSKEEVSPSQQESSMIKSTVNVDELHSQVHGCLGPIYGSINWHAIYAWVKFYSHRWNMSHADIFIRQDQVASAEQHFRDAMAMDDSYKHVTLNFTNLPNEEGETGKVLHQKYHSWLIDQCLQNAKRNKREYLLQFDADEFLISDTFSTVDDMFKYANRSAVSFPMFHSGYHKCSSNRPTYGSVTYHSLLPFASKWLDGGRGEESFQDAPPSCAGHRKYIVKTEYFEELTGVHDPLGECRSDVNMTYYMSGRASDNEHARLVHLREGVGIHADMGYGPCSNVLDCEYLDKHRNCVRDRESAFYMNHRTSVNEILSELPLNSKFGDEDLKNSVCYAERYPHLLEGYCGGNSSLCSYGGLREHYDEHGAKDGLLWDC